MNHSPFTYSAFGLRLVSNRPLQGLKPTACAAAPSCDLRIEFCDESSQAHADPAGESLWYTTDILNEHGEPGLKIWKGRTAGEYFIRYINGLTFCFDSAIRRVLASCSSPMTHADVCSFLLGPVMGIALRIKGITCLHASVVEVNGVAVVFVGPMGSGKSTTAAILARNGHAVLADDVAALERCKGAFIVRPAYPFLNLLPDSMSLVFGAKERAREPSGDAEKIQLVLEERGLEFWERSLVLGKIYLLDRTNQASETAVNPIQPKEAFIELTCQTYANKILDPEMRSREFEMISELVKLVPVSRLIVPASGQDTGNLYRAILHDSSGA